MGAIKPGKMNMEEIGVQDRESEKTPFLSDKIWRRFPLMGSCLFGLVFGFALAVALISRWPKQRQTEMFFLSLVPLVTTCSFCWHWLFFMRPDKLKKKLEKENANDTSSDLVHPNG